MKRMANASRAILAVGGMACWMGLVPGGAIPVAAQTTISVNTTIACGDTAYDGQDLIVDGATLTVDCPHSFQSLALIDGARLTCPDNPTTPTHWIDLAIAGDLAVDSTSVIDGVGKGWPALMGPGAGATSGSYGSGAGHGGPGTVSTNRMAGGGAYGSYMEPSDFGSGGGLTTGRPGGGRIRLVVGGTLTVQGSILANAGATGNGAGGAGGSLWIETGVLAGSGALRANGSAPRYTTSGAGGGGRISISYDSSSFTGILEARGEKGPNLTPEGQQYGGAGTVYLENRAAGTSVLRLDNGGFAGQGSPLSIALPTNLELRNGACVEFATPPTLNSLLIASGGILTHKTNTPPGLVATVAGDATIESGGIIHVEGKGHPAQTGPGAGGTSGSYDGGGGHGGVGHSPTLAGLEGAAYGSITEPSTFGSGGGGAKGAAGGGAVWLSVAGTLAVDGTINANAQPTSAAVPDSGGAGGSVYLRAGALSGNGSIAALGTYRANQGGGGGGRIAIHADSSTFGGVLNAAGGGVNSTTYPAPEYRDPTGGAGTIFLKIGSATPELRIDNGGKHNQTTPFGDVPACRLLVSGGAAAELLTTQTLESVRIETGSDLTHPREGPPIALFVSDGFELDADCRVDLVGRGYGPLEGPGAGMTSELYPSLGGGAGHGGRGHSGHDGNGAGGPAYGSAEWPIFMGSGGGGIKVGWKGQAGGGALRLQAGGTVRIDGIVNADGEVHPNSSDNIGGGSGGSVLIVAPSVEGEGSISAKGASPGSNCGGGAGGRIAIRSNDISTILSQNLDVSGGGVTEPGEPGTIVLLPLSTLSIASLSPGPFANQSLDHIDIQFTQAIDGASFTAADVELRDPAGQLVAVSEPFADLGGDAWRVSFSPQSAAGTYPCRIGPHISGAGGGELDQDADGVGGEDPGDVFVASITLDFTAPRLVNVFPQDTILAPVDGVTLVFSEAVESDCAGASPSPSLTGPGGSIPIASIAPADTAHAAWRVSFPTQSLSGLYTLQLPACFHDPAGNPIGAPIQEEFTIALPDLAVSNLVVPDGLRTLDEVSITWRVSNIGSVTAIKPWEDRLYLSTDAVWDAGDRYLAYVYNGTSLAPGEFYERTPTVAVPDVTPGNYHILVVTDYEGQVVEADESAASNVAVSPLIPLRTIDYEAIVAPENDMYQVGQPVVLIGRAFKTVDGSPAPNESVRVRVRTRGITRRLDVATDENGDFQTTFQPIPTEAGHYQVAAAHPARLNATPDQDQFRIVGMRIVPDEAAIRVAPGAPTTVTLQLINLGAVPLSNLSTDILYGPPNVAIQAPVPATLPGDAILTVPVTLLAADASVRRKSFQVRFTCDEHAEALFQADLTILNETPELLVNPAYLKTGMARGAQTLVEFDIRNDGGAAATGVSLALPEVPWLSLASGTIPDRIESGESFRATLALLPAADLNLGLYEGNLALTAANAPSRNIPFQFHCVSEARGDLIVDVVDELTYYAPEAPHVAGANVLLKNDIHEVVAQGTTNSSGTLAFADLPAGQYLVEVRAGKHTGARKVATVQSEQTTTTTVFASRNFVTYLWSVVETEIEDYYTFVVETVFETYVPAPALFVDPPILHLDSYPDEYQTEFTITNIGWIAANNARAIPWPSEEYDVIPLAEDLGDIPARSSVTLPVLLKKKQPPQPGAFGPERSLLLLGDCSFGMGMFVYYEYVCGEDNKDRRVPVGIQMPSYDCPAEGTPKLYSIQDIPGGMYWDTGSAGGGGYAWDEGGYQLSDSCNLCQEKIIKELYDCALGYIPLSCIPGIIMGMRDTIEGCYAGEPTTAGCRDSAISAGGGAILGCIAKLGPLGPWWNTGWCIYNIYHACDGLPINAAAARARNLLSAMNWDLPPWIDQLPPEIQAAMQDLGDAGRRIETLLNLMDYILGSNKWMTLDSEQFLPGIEILQAFFESAEAGSDGGLQITAVERAAILAMQRPKDILESDVVALIDRWERTVEYHAQGYFTAAQLPAGWNDDFIDYETFTALLDAAIAAEEESNSEGYSCAAENLNAAFAGLIEALNNSPSGVCAQVRVRVEQSAVLARSAFNATLEISNNGDAETLENVELALEIADDTGSSTLSRFFVQSPTLTGIDDIKGGGSIGPGQTARIEWTLIPTRDAAPTKPERYLIGAHLTYTLNRAVIDTPILPDSIWVRPDPALQVDYFHERVVYGNDPWTEEVEEPSVPYTLGMIVSNAGAGTARHLRIESGAPEIVDNDKGLLIQFRILAAQLGLNPVSPQLTVDFGDIAPGEHKVARWLFESSLQGEFIDYAASFTHRDELGGEDTSIFDRVGIHPLAHTILVDRPDDDGMPDFLVNDVIDPEAMPDTIYSSEGFQLPVNVAVNIATDGPVTDEHRVVRLTFDPPTGWVYARLADPAGEGREFILRRVERADGRVVPLDWNAWSTHRWIRKGASGPIDPQREDLLHLVDFNSGGVYDLYYELVDPMPELVVVPSSLDFGGIEVGAPTAVVKNLQLVNQGPGSLQVVRVTVVDDPEGNFALVDSQTAFDIPSGQQRVLGARFQPMTPGAKTALLRVESNDPTHPTLDIPLAGVGQAPIPDRDGDGFSDDFETDSGSDPDDPESVPAHLDRNGDGRVDLVDALIFYRQIQAGEGGPWSPLDDLNGDGSITTDDAVVFFQNRIGEIRAIPDNR